MDFLVGVVAIGGVRDVTRRRGAGGFSGRGVAVPIAIGVRIPGGGGGRVQGRVIVVDIPIAVVIHAVADLGGVGMNGVVGVIAIPVRERTAARRGTPGTGARYTKAVTIQIPGVRAFVDIAVAGVVHPVDHLRPHTPIQ